MKQTQKMLIASLIALGAIFAACSSAKNLPAGRVHLKDGVYTQSARGHNGPVTLQTTVKDGRFFAVEVIQSAETAGIGSKVISLMCDAAIASDSVNIDGISGATVTSGCVKQILKETAKEAGASDKQIASMPSVQAQASAAKKEYTYDLVIVGAGGAGLTAAITASEKGAKVAILEKNGFAGGNTLVSGGGLNVPGSDLQQKKGIADSPEKYAADTMKGGDNKNNTALVSIMAENALASYEWLRDNINVAFIQDRVQQFGGHSVPRACIPRGNSGYGAYRAFIEKM